MNALISEKELHTLLEAAEVTEYYGDIDMNGAITIAIPPTFSDKKDTILSLIKEWDKKRTIDEIYELNQIFYPVKRIVIDDDEDQETLERFKKKDITKAYYSQQLNTWIHSKKINNNSRTPRLAFYSYKGGVGRSTALAVVARLLAKEGLKVAIVDLDLEAPGINSLLLTKPKLSPFGVVDYLYQAQWIREAIDKKRFVSHYIVREDVPRRNEKPGQLIIMTAGGTVANLKEEQKNLLFDEDEVEIKLDSNYMTKLSYIDFDVYARQENNVFEALLDDIDEYSEADIILLDARTGISNISGAIINQYSDFLSIHVQDNKQNREGIEFIIKHLDNDKMKNTIWSYTKENKSSNIENFKNFIISAINKKNPSNEQIQDMNFIRLPYDSVLEDINAYELKKHIDADRISVMYKELADLIMAMTGLDKRLPTYIGMEDRKAIIQDFRRLMEDNKNKIYISQRFLNEDLEIFVGFPGSGKKTFSQYMLKQYNKNVKVYSFEEFMQMDTSAHRQLSHVAFLDWNYEEATQAVCKWFLQSKTFLNWLSKNETLLKDLDETELIEMRDIPEFELPHKAAESILDYIFQKDRFYLGWRYIFNHLQYRDGYVLPKDLLLGIQLLIQHHVGHFEEYSHKHKGTKALFPMFIGQIFYEMLWKEIGESKKQWLLDYDEALLFIIKAYQSEIPPKKIYSDEELKIALFQALLDDMNMSKKLFEEKMEKAMNMNIFIKRKIAPEEEILTLAPIYHLIDMDK